MNIKHLFLSATTALFTLALAGCGDGGGPGPAPQPTATTGSGFVSKGIIKNGKVIAQELDARGTVLREVGNATTGADGGYTLAIGNGYAGGPVLFTVSATSATTMVCDVRPNCAKVSKNFGEDFLLQAADPSFQMTALLSGATAGEKLTVQITPFTHMSAQRAMARLPALPAGTTPAKAVDEANSEMNNLLGGLDVLRSRPRNLANADDMKEATATEKAYALLTSAIGKLALDNTGTGLTIAIQRLADSFKEGKIKADEGASPDDSRYSLKEILDAAQAQRTSLSLSDDSGVLADLETDIANAGAGDIDPEPSPNAGDTRVAKIKGLVASMRTWGNQIQNLEGPAKAFANEIDMANQATRSFQGPIGQSLMNGVALMGMIADTAQSGGTFPYGQDTSYDPNFQFGTPGSGTVTVSDCVNGKFTARLQGTLGTESLDLTSVDDCPPVGQTTVPGGSSSLTGTVENNGIKLGLDKGSITFNYTAPLNPDVTTPEEMLAAIKDFSLQFKATLAQKGVAEPVSFTGEGQFDVVRCETCTTNPTDPTATLNPSLIKLSGGFNKGAKSFTGTADATLNNATTFDRNQPETGSNVAKSTLTLTLTAKLDSLPQAQFTFTLNRTGYVNKIDLGTANLTIAHGGNTLRVDASKTSAAPAALTLVFANQDGVKLSVSGVVGSRSGDVTLDNVNLGKVEEIGKTGIFKVSYNDGTFETIN